MPPPGPIVALGVAMRRAVVFASLVLWPSFWAPRSSGAERPLHGARTRCLGASGPCYSVHLARLPFRRAQEACAEHGGGLSTASGPPEVRALLALLAGLAEGSGASLFWLGLVRKAQQCTREDLPLRGFSWAPPARLQEAAGNESAPTEEEEVPPRWLREPSKSCTVQRCAGLQVTLGRPGLEPWGLREHACAKASPGGYICKSRHARACPALQGADGEPSPPGTELALSCPDGRQARFLCRLSPDGAHWEGAQGRLCSCPSGYWSPRRAACVEPPDCRGPRGAFLCLCARGSRLAADEDACLGPTGAGGTASTARPSLPTAPAAGGAFPPAPSGRPGPNSSTEEEAFPSGAGNDSAAGTAEKPPASADASNYVFILITVAVVMLVILVMAALQGFQACFRMCAAKGSPQPPGKDGAAAAAATDSEHSLGPSKAEAAEAPQEEPQPVGGQEGLEQP